MRDRELDRINAAEIFVIHQMLATRFAMRFLSELSFERGSYLIKHRHCGQAQMATLLFEPGAGLRVDQSEQDQSGIVSQIRHNSIEMLTRAHHRPEMANDGGIIELRERGFGDHLQRFAGRVRNKVQVKRVHACF